MSKTIEVCDQCRPKMGEPTRCIRCALIQANYVISRIDYMLHGPPNEMEISMFDTDLDPMLVLERVRKYITARVPMPIVPTVRGTVEPIGGRP